MESIGDRVRRTREQKGIARGDLARSVGLSYTGLSDLELGKAKSTTRLHKLASELAVDVDWLETGKGSPDPRQPAPLSVSRSLRLDPSIVRDVAQALQETYAELGLVYSITAEPELFAEFYERAVALGSVESRSNLVWLGTRLRKGEASQGADSEQSKGVGNQGNGAGKTRRHRAKG